MSDLLVSQEDRCTARDGKGLIDMDGLLINTVKN